MATVVSPRHWSLAVNWGLDLDDPTRALYRRMVDLLSAVTAVPADRHRYYSAYDFPPEYVINGWTGIVNDVRQADGGGYVATVSVFPTFAPTDAGALPTLVSD